MISTSNENNNYDSDENNTSLNVYYKDTYIYGWGKNTYGEIGVGTKENVLIPSPIKTFQSQIITNISSGGKHSILITDEGKLYICGSNMFGLLGNNASNEVVTNQKYQNKFKIMNYLEESGEFITQVACAEFHSLCLNQEGQIFAWGGNLHNKLGQTGALLGQPLKIPSLINKKIVSIACGDYHSCALTSNGELYTWGGGGSYNRGQCGQGNLKDIDTPKKVDFFKNNRVVKVSCGGYHTIVLCENGNLYGFGKGEYGQCGYGDSQDTPTPKLVKFNSKMVAYYERESIKQENREEFNPPLTLKNNTKNELNDTSVKIDIKDIKCGGEHTIILSSFGRIYTFGHGYTGQLGLGNNKNYCTPIIVMSLAKKTVNQIAAGWSHSMILTSEGNLYVAGCGKYGELGLTKNDNLNRYNFTLVRTASKLNITNIYAGGHHSWIITDNIAPEKMDFEMPSPLESPNYSYIGGKDNTPTKEQGSARKIDKEPQDSFVMNKDLYKATNNSNNFNNTQKILISDNNGNNLGANNDSMNNIGNSPYSKKFSGDGNKNNQFNKNNLISLNNSRKNTSNKNILSDNNSRNMSGGNNFSQTNSNLFNLDMLGDNLNSILANKIQIQIAFSDLNLSHRFVRFEISKTNKNYNLPFKDIDNLFKNFFSKDKANILYRLQDDKEVLSNCNTNMKSPSPVMDVLFREMKNYQIFSSGNPNYRSFSLNIIYDYNKNQVTRNLREESLENQRDINYKPPYSIMLLNEDDINNDPNESVLSGWMFDIYNNFYELFKEDSNNPENGNILIPRFLELRPYYFNSN